MMTLAVLGRQDDESHGQSESSAAEAVKEIEKPLLIIAGAGSGKTLTVASKIAYLIEQGRQNREHTCLSF